MVRNFYKRYCAKKNRKGNFREKHERSRTKRPIFHPRAESKIIVRESKETAGWRLIWFTKLVANLDVTAWGDEFIVVCRGGHVRAAKRYLTHETGFLEQTLSFGAFHGNNLLIQDASQAPSVNNNLVMLHNFPSMVYALQQGANGIIVTLTSEERPLLLELTRALPLIHVTDSVQAPLPSGAAPLRLNEMTLQPASTS